MQSPDFFYFDLGNVVVHFDHQLACHQLAALSGLQPGQVEQIVFHTDLSERYERGDLSTADFHQAFCDLSAAQVDHDRFVTAVSDIFKLNTPVVPIITRLKALGHRLGILSNTCDAHWQWIQQRYDVVSELFDVHALSFQMQLLKPDRSIYQAASRMIEPAADRIFFVDDRSENVAGAQAASWDAILFRGAADLSGALRARGIAI